MAKCDGTDANRTCPHCGGEFVLDCEPNYEPCPVCEDDMEWVKGFERYECDVCGHVEAEVQPTECWRCGQAWPFVEASDG